MSVYDRRGCAGGAQDKNSGTHLHRTPVSLLNLPQRQLLLLLQTELRDGPAGRRDGRAVHLCPLGARLAVVVPDVELRGQTLGDACQLRKGRSDVVGDAVRSDVESVKVRKEG